MRRIFFAGLCAGLFLYGCQTSSSDGTTVYSGTIKGEYVPQALAHWVHTNYGELCSKAFKDSLDHGTPIPASCHNLSGSTQFVHNNPSESIVYLTQFDFLKGPEVNCTKYSLTTKTYSVFSHSTCEYWYTFANGYDSVTINSMVDTSVVVPFNDLGGPFTYDDTCFNSFIAGNHNKSLSPAQCFTFPLSANAKVGKYVYQGKQLVHYGTINDSLKLAVIPDTTYSKSTTTGLLFNIPTPVLTAGSKVTAECADAKHPDNFQPDSLFTPYAYLDPSIVMLYEYKNGCHLNDKYRITIKN